MSRGSVSHPYQLLGLTNEKVGPFGLLGVSPDRCTPEVVRRALHAQLARLNAHPFARSSEADALRVELQAAADLLSDPETLDELRSEYHRQLGLAPSTSPSGSGSSASEAVAPASVAAKIAPPTSPAPAPPPTATPAPAASQPAPTAQTPASAAPRRVTPLSPTEQELVMAIVSSGGWNARARRRSAAIATQRGLDLNALVRSLVKVGSTPLVASATATAPATGGATAPATPTVSSGASTPAVTRTLSDAEAPAPAAEADSMRRVTPEDVESERHAVRNLTAAAVTFVIGAVITIPFGLYVFNELATIPDPAPSEMSFSEEAAPSATITPGDRRTAPVTPTRRAQLQALPDSSRAEINAVAALIINSPALTEESVRRFGAVLNFAGRQWPRLDTQSRAAVRGLVASALFERGDSSDEATVLLNRIEFPEELASAEDVHRWIWSASTLVSIASEPDLPRPAAQIIEQRLKQRRIARPARAGISYDEAAQSSVIALLERLSTSGEDPLPLWLAWVEAVEAVHDPSEVEGTLLTATHRLLAAGPELERSAAARALATALLQRIDWSSSVEARQRALAWYDDPSISSADLMMLTAYLVAHADIAGLDDSFVLSADASAAERSQEREELARAWRISDAANDATLTLAMSGEAREWVAQIERELDKPVAATIEDMMTQLVRLTQLNEAARLLEAGRVGEARTVMTDGLVNAAAQVARQTPIVAPAMDSDARPSRDGEFAARLAYRDKLNDREGQVRLIRNLLTEPAEDLGPADAGALAAAAIAPSPREVRNAALDAIETAYANGPNMLLVFGDLIPPDRRDSKISTTIERVTGRKLPDHQSHEWYAQARLALLERVIALRGAESTSQRIDALAEVIGQSYENRAASVTPDAAPAGAVSSSSPMPALAAWSEFERWIERARPMAPIAPIPGSLADVERRAATRYALSVDPIGAFAAAQLGIFEAMAYVTSAERPTLRDELQQMLTDTTHARTTSRSALEQLIVVEKAMMRLWRWRFSAAQGGTT